MSELDELFRQRDEIVAEMREFSDVLSPAEMVKFWDRLAPIETEIYEAGGTV